MNKQEIYNEYLSSTLHEAELIVKLDSIQKKTVKSDGVIYTPWNIVEFMIEDSKPQSTDIIMEPSCGHGAFLFGLLYYANSNFNLSGNDLLSWFKTNVIGVDISDNTIIELREMLSLFFKKHYNLSVQPSEFTNVYCDDGLSPITVIDYGLTIGNPPYIRTKNLDEAYLKSLRNTYKSCEKGNVDIYYAFIEKYSKSSKKLSFITPGGFLNNASGKALRNVLKDKLTKLIDFKDKKIFEDASVYTCILTTVKNSGPMVDYSNDISEPTVAVSRESILNKKVEAGKKIDVVYSGIATLSDKVFKVTKDNDKFYAIFEGQKFEVEKGIVVPYLKLTKIKTSVLLKTDYMIYPYDLNKKIIPEDVFMKDYPLAYNYLLKNKTKLNQRDKGKTSKYENWYAYGRKQGLNAINAKKIVIIPGMIGGDCIPREVDITAVMAGFHTMVFTSGYIVPRGKDTDNSCDSILSQKFTDFIKTVGKPWPGTGESYYSLTSKQVKSFSG